MPKDASLTIRIPADLKAELEAAAQKDGRSTSNLAERILNDWVKAQASTAKRQR